MGAVRLGEDVEWGVEDWGWRWTGGWNTGTGSELLGEGLGQEMDCGVED